MSRNCSINGHLLIDCPRSGSDNMEIDRFLLSQAESSDQPITWVRFYTWRRPTVSLGQHQKASQAIDEGFCRGAGVDVVKRPTGGRAVFHDAELTYAVVSNDTVCFPQPQVDRTYHQIALALLEGLRLLGVEAELARSPLRRAEPFSGAGSPCFATASRHEILWRGRKLVGSAQRRLRRSFLQHGSIPFQLDWRLMARIFRLTPDDLRCSMVGLREAGATLPMTSVQDCLARGFEKSFRIELQHTRLHPLSSGVRAGGVR